MTFFIVTKCLITPWNYYKLFFYNKL
jgi:hypothetical protein